MKTRLLSALSLALAVIMSACSSSEKQETARTLLATVPSDAAYTAVININGLITSTGGKIKDNTVAEPTEMVRGFLAKLPGKKIGANVDSILAGKLGIDFTCAVLFENEGTVWLTAPLADPIKTKDYLGRHGYDLQSVGDGLVAARDCVIAENQVWLSSDSIANAAAVETFRRINSEQSMLSSDYSETLTELKEVYIDIWDVNMLWQTLGSGADQARLVTAFTFEDVRYASFSASLTENSLTATGRFLNSEFKDSKCNLATGKLSAKDFNVLGEKVQAVAGLSIDDKLMKNVIKAVSAFGGAIPPSTSEALRNIEGALVVGADADNNLLISIPCKKGKENSVKDAAEALMLIAGNNPSLRLTSQPGSVLISFNGGPQSGTSPAALGEKLSGAWLGLAFTSDYYPSINPVKSVSVALVPAGSSRLEFQMKVNY